MRLRSYTNHSSSSSPCSAAAAGAAGAAGCRFSSLPSRAAAAAGVVAAAATVAAAAPTPLCRCCRRCCRPARGAVDRSGRTAWTWRPRWTMTMYLTHSHCRNVGSHVRGFAFELEQDEYSVPRSVGGVQRTQPVVSGGWKLGPSMRAQSIPGTAAVDGPRRAESGWPRQ